MFEASIPVVDFRDFADAAMHARFVGALGDGLARFGFVAVVGHGIAPFVLDEAYAAARRLFALPGDAKARCEQPYDGRQRGYTSFGIEHAKDHAMPDLKEFWQIGRDLGPDHPAHESGEVPRNVFPVEFPASGPVFTDLFRRLDEFAMQTLDAIGEYLGQPSAFFRDMVRDGNSVLRVIHYPEVGGCVPKGAVRAARHEDINLLTVLPAATASGLELLRVDGTWLAVTTPPDVLIVDTGDMMKLVTDGTLPATTHRVVNPEDGAAGARFSMPFFLHPHPDARLRPLGSTHPGIRARDFLFERLREIGVA
jgi:isopenicillin N synthase-like dioxygenase